MPDPAPETDADGAVLVPVGESVTLRKTVAYAVGVAAESDDPTVHFVAPVAWQEIGDADDELRRDADNLLERIEVWAREDAGDAPITIETAVVGSDEYLFSPDDYARVLAAYADDHGIGRIAVDPEFSPGGNVPLLQPMETNLRQRGFDLEEAPVETAVRRRQLTGAGSGLQFALLFGISFLFYQLLGGFAIVTGDSFDLYYELFTGTIAAGIVAGALHRVTMSRRPRLRVLAGQLGRLVLFVPYLLYEIIKSNILITYIILHPNLPIDPRLTRVRVAVWGGPALTTLANSITLTPGTLTVRTKGQTLYVHGLFGGAREGVAGGALERAVRFVFYGRRSAAVATPEERGDYEELQGDEFGDNEETQGDEHGNYEEIEGDEPSNYEERQGGEE